MVKLIPCPCGIVWCCAVWLTMVLSVPLLANECFPRPDNSKSQYIVAYGGFLYRESRKSTPYELKLAQPVWVDGYKRGWLTRSKPDVVRITELGVVPSPGDKFNGVLLNVNAKRLKALDRDPDKKYYCRVRLKRSLVSSISGQVPLPDGEYWFYETRKKHRAEEPLANYPIYQSQVDEFLTGCIEQSERFKLPDFADQCMKTTQGWSSNWVNDRDRPVFSRLVQNRKRQVDELLLKYQKQYFGPIRLG